MGQNERAVNSPATDLVLVGEIAAPFGIRGEVKVRPLLDNFALLGQLPSVNVRLANNTPLALRVAAMRNHQGNRLVSFDGYDRNAAESLRGAKIFLARDQFPALPDGEYYEWQLLGLDVITDSGESLGKIDTVHFNLVANDVYETTLALIPAIESVILKIDLDAGKMLVKDIPGLRRDS